jgi:hypothetical protein
MEIMESPTLEHVGEDDVALDMDGWELDLVFRSPVFSIFDHQ